MGSFVGSDSDGANATSLTGITWPTVQAGDTALLVWSMYPENLYAERAPYDHDDYRRNVLEPQIRKLQERGIYAAQDDHPAA